MPSHLQLPFGVIRSTVRNFQTLEECVQEDQKFQGPEYAKMAVLKYEDDSGALNEIEIRDSMNPDRWNPYIAKMVDGSIAIYAPIFKMDPSIVIPALAHEVGHLVSGHFRIKKTPMIDRNTRKQKLYYQRYLGSKSDIDANLYSNAVYFGMLRGGVTDTELEADLAAMRYVSRESIILLHSLYLHTDEPIPAQEKLNRLKRLAQMRPAKPDMVFELIIGNPENNVT